MDGYYYDTNLYSNFGSFIRLLSHVDGVHTKGYKTALPTNTKGLSTYHTNRFTDFI